VEPRSATFAVVIHVSCTGGVALSPYRQCSWVICLSLFVAAIPLQRLRAASEEKSLPVKCVCFSPDGKSLAVGGGYLRSANVGRPWGGEGFVRAFDATTFKESFVVREQFTSFVGSLSFMESDTIVAVSDDYKRDAKGRSRQGIGIRYFSVPPKREGRGRGLTIQQSNSPCFKMAFHSTSGLAAYFRLPFETVLQRTSGRGGTILLHEGYAHFLCFSPDGKTVLSCAPEVALRANPYSNIRLYDTDTGKELSSFDPDGSFVEFAQFSTDGKKLGLLCRNGKAYVLKADLKTRLNVLDVKEISRALAFGHGGETLAVKTATDTVKIFDVKSGKALQSFAKNLEGVNCVAFSPNGALLAVGGGDADAKGVVTAPGCVRVWDVKNGTLLATLR
jgi:WD40 repeat protein